MNRNFWREFYDEEERIEALEDEQEKKIRYQLMDAIKDKANDYDLHVAEYEYVQKRREVIQRGAVFLPQENNSALKSKWSILFAKSVDGQTKKKINYAQFKWHIFSFEAITAQSGMEARKAFDQSPKQEVYAFYQNRKEAFLIKNPSVLQSEDFDLDDDIYLFDPMEKWTYVHTHEEQCGPYFYSADYYWRKNREPMDIKTSKNFR